jgi:hypothetical protein
MFGGTCQDVSRNGRLVEGGGGSNRTAATD